MQELEEYKNKYATLSQQSTYDTEIRLQDRGRLKTLEEEKSLLESRLHKTESELTSCEIARENLKRDKVIVSIISRCLRTEFSTELGLWTAICLKTKNS